MIKASRSEWSSNNWIGYPSNFETKIIDVWLTKSVVLNKKNQIATNPKARFPRTRGGRLNLDSSMLNPAATINGKKNRPAKSLNFPVIQDGLIVLKTWSLSKSTAILNNDSGCCKHRKLFSKP